MVFIFFAAIITNFYDGTAWSFTSETAIVNYIGAGLIVVGVIPLVIFYPKAKEYYTRKPLEVPEDFSA